MATITHTAATAAEAHQSRAERLVAEIDAMPIGDVRQRIDEARRMTGPEIEERQRVERRERAERAAAALRSI
ncbi:hypothetical protein ACFRFH_05265 [Leifsonia sp. NPDC056824]|uniref:hypothetical protein n=1 Tax=Leifsonia sp. NPDC056824 TaxID=3345953 RepID=UPI0036C854D1